MWDRADGKTAHTNQTVYDVAVRLASDFGFSVRESEEVIGGQEAKTFFLKATPAKRDPNFETDSEKEKRLTPIPMKSGQKDSTTDEENRSNSSEENQGSFRKSHSISVFPLDFNLFADTKGSKLHTLEQQLLGAYNEAQAKFEEEKTTSRKRKIKAPFSPTTASTPSTASKKIRKTLKAPATTPKIKKETATTITTQSLLTFGSPSAPTNTTPTKPTMKELQEELKVLRQAEREASNKVASLQSTVDQLLKRLDEKDADIQWLRSKM